VRILFLCTGNSARSQMAEGWARQLLGAEHEIHSAGTHPVGVNPVAIEAMHERGIDIRGQHSKGLGEVPETADLLVTLCSDAAETCPTYPGAKQVQHWNLPDPVSVWGSPEVIRDEFRRVRDEIEKRLQRLATELEGIGRSP
jgi:arsenate reductase